MPVETRAPKTSTPETHPDPRINAVRVHFQEWHGAAPDGTEIEALLQAIDRAELLGGEAESITRTPESAESLEAHMAYVEKHGHQP